MIASAHALLAKYASLPEPQPPQAPHAAAGAVTGRSAAAFGRRHHDDPERCACAAFAVARREARSAAAARRNADVAAGFRQAGGRPALQRRRP